MKTRVIWHLEVPKHLNDELQRILDDPNSDYRTKAEFIREAVRMHIHAIKRDKTGALL